MLSFNRTVVLAFAVITWVQAGFAGIVSSSIAVTNSSNVLIPDGTASTSLYADTNFGNVAVSGATKVIVYTIHNLSDNANLNLTDTVQISGTNAGDFTVTQAPPAVIATNAPLGITFNPSGSGTRTALVTIKNDDFDEAVYTFAISGTGNGFAIAAPNLKLVFAGEIKGKIKTKTNTAKVNGKLTISNLGPVAMDGSNLQVYFSRDHVLDDEDTLLVEVPIKPLAAFDPDKPKEKKLKFKAEQGPSAQNGGYLFVRAFPLPLSIQDLDWTNNTVHQHYLVSNPVGP